MVKEYNRKPFFLLLAKSCSDVKMLDSTVKTGPYVIDSDGEGELKPFNVTCNMTDKDGVGVTVISHDSENKTRVDKCKDRGCYSRNISYTGASFPQLASLTRVSKYCEQFIKYECKASKIFASKIFAKKISSKARNRSYAWWMSRDSIKMTYWDGADANSDKCACGIERTCVNRTRRCNCDTNDKEWREDSGLLTNKTHLPVRQLRFGDTDNDREEGHHTLGKFKCYGIA